MSGGFQLQYIVNWTFSSSEYSYMHVSQRNNQNLALVIIQYRFPCLLYTSDAADE